MERDVRAGRHAQARAQARNKATGRRSHTPAAKEALSKQNFNIVPSKSVEEARTWLAGEIATWQQDHLRGEDRDVGIVVLILRRPRSGRLEG